jgi:hypothetical protein
MDTNIVNSLVDNIRNSFEGLWAGMLDIIPGIAEGIVILVVGWIVAKLISRFVGKIIEVIRLDNLLATAGVKGFFQRAGIKLNIDRVFEEMVKWFILIVFFISAANAFGLPQINGFLSDVLNYIPNVIIASIIMILGILIANFVADLAHGTTQATKTGKPHLAGAITKYAVIVFTGIVALDQLQVGATLLDSFFNNLGLAIAAAFGLAFGLGGKDAAADAIKKMRKDMVGPKGKK